MTEGNGSVSYPIRDLLAQLNGKVDAILAALGSKVDRHDFDALRDRVQALELADAGRDAVSSDRRWFWPVVLGAATTLLVGGIGAAVTLVWLAHG